jgi:26S proteasome regulatory subunit N5
MQELQVETFGSMERREKMDFILEQMRLLRIQQDWEKLAIVSKKINSKWLAEPENEVSVLSPVLVLHYLKPV